MRTARGVGASLAIAIALGASSAAAQIIIPVGPPMPVASPPSPAALRTMRELDEAKYKDAGRKLEWVWIDVGGGFEQLGMTTFGGGNNFTGGLVNTSASGGVVTGAIGARLLFFTFLVRGAIGVFSTGELYRVGPELGFHVPLGRVEPHVALGAGYAAVGALHDEVGGVAAQYLALRGGYVRAGGGLDYFVHPAVSIGFNASAELLGLVRPALSTAELSLLKKSLPTGRAISGDLSQSSSGIGGTIALTAVLGLHF